MRKPKIQGLWKSVVRSRKWRHRRRVEPKPTACALASCAGPQSLWQRLRRRYRPSGTYLQGAFYCQPACLETALLAQLSRLRIVNPAPQAPNRIPLGLLMVARGTLTYVEVRAALEAQRRARYGKIGEWIEKLGFATEQEVTSALALQWGCPVAASFDPATLPSPGNIPQCIMEAFQMLPLNYAASTQTLYLAFGERVDHGALCAIEKILDCRTQPCVAGRKSVATQLEAMRELPHPSNVEFGPINDLAEMARIAASYTTRLNPSQVRLSRIGRFIWLRLNVGMPANGSSAGPSRADREFGELPEELAESANGGQDDVFPRIAPERAAVARRAFSRPHALTTNLVFRLGAEPPRPLPFNRPLRELAPAARPLTHF